MTRTATLAATRTAALGAVAALALLAVVPAGATTPPAPVADVGKVEGGSFAIDKAHAKIIFSTTHFGFSTYYGLFTDFDATLRFDPKAPEKSAITVDVDLNGVHTTNAKLDEHLKSPDFFDAARFPKAVFKATHIQVKDPAHGTIVGDLTLHGVTKPVTLDATFNGGGVNPMSKAYVLGFNATGVLKRSDFGITTFIPAVGDAVTLTISGEFDRQP